jgi:hypothetical protein
VSLRALMPPFAVVGPYERDLLRIVRGAGQVRLRFVAAPEVSAPDAVAHQPHQSQQPADRQPTT